MGVKRVKSFVGGYHEYKETWEPEIGQEAMLKQEPQDKPDSNTVAVVRCNTSLDRIQRKQESSDATQFSSTPQRVQL